MSSGQFFDISDQEMDDAILKSLSYAKTPNPEGLKLQKQFTYEKTVETILCAISSQMWRVMCHKRSKASLMAL